MPAGPYSWRLRSGFSPDEKCLRTPETLTADDERLLNSPTRSAGTRVVRFSHQGETLILKEYRAAGPTARLKAMFRVPAALRALRISLRLARLGLPVVEVLGAGSRKRSPWHSFLLTREIPSVVPLRTYLRRSGPRRGPAIVALARTLGRLHSSNLLHRDAHLANFVVQTTNPQPRVIIVDVDGIRPCRGVTLALAARDISRLLDYSEPSSRQMMRFAVAYSRARSGAVLPRDLLREMRAYYETRARRPVQPV